MSLYESIPSAPVEVRQWDGSVYSYDEIERWAGVGRVMLRGQDGSAFGFAMTVLTPTGQAEVPKFGWIVKRTDRDFYSMDDATFRELYREVGRVSTATVYQSTDSSTITLVSDEDEDWADPTGVLAELEKADNGERRELGTIIAALERRREAPDTRDRPLDINRVYDLYTAAIAPLKEIVRIELGREP